MHAALSRDKEVALKRVFSPNPPSFYELACALAPYELTHVRASPGDCAAGWAQAAHARFESSEAGKAAGSCARTAVELHECCASLYRIQSVACRGAPRTRPLSREG
eukprot:scaffold41101_cov68-Phaeocystis_antarctica.AAC.1